MTMELTDLLVRDEGKTERPLLKGFAAVRPCVTAGTRYPALQDVEGIDTQLETAWFREMQAALRERGFELAESPLPDSQDGSGKLDYAVRDVTGQYGDLRMRTFYEFVFFRGLPGEYRNDPLAFFESRRPQPATR